MSGASDPQPLSLRELAIGVRNDFFQWDRGLIATFLALCWRPGSVARGYVFDRDVRYTPPWRYLLIGVFVNTAATWFVLHQAGGGNLTHASTRAAAILLENAALLTLLTLPLFALAMRLLFIGMQVRFVDALVVLFYAQGHVNLLSVASLGLASAGQRNVATGLDALLLAYLIWAWAAFALGPLWRRLLASIFTLVAGQFINAGIVYLVTRFG